MNKSQCRVPDAYLLSFDYLILTEIKKNIFLGKSLHRSRISENFFCEKLWAKSFWRSVYWGQILGRNWDKSLKSFPSSNIFYPHPPHLSKSGVKLVCNVNIVYGNLKSENPQDYDQKPQRNCMFMNSASVYVKRLKKLDICSSVDIMISPLNQFL